MIEIEVEGEVLQIGTLVDSVLEVLDVPESNIQPSPSIEAKYRLDFITRHDSPRRGFYNAA